MGLGARSGAIAGLVGCGVFLVLHALWIVPIWPVAPVGFAIAAAAGAALGVMLERLRLPDRPLARAIGAFAAAALVLAPGAVTAEAGLRVGNAPGIVVVAGFLFPILGAGAGLGWLGGRTRGAARAGAGAGLLLAIGPGHNIPFLAGTRAVPLELSIVAIVLGAASLAFVVAAALPRRSAGRQSAGEPTL